MNNYDGLFADGVILFHFSFSVVAGHAGKVACLTQMVNNQQ